MNDRAHICRLNVTYTYYDFALYDKSATKLIVWIRRIYEKAALTHCFRDFGVARWKLSFGNTDRSGADRVNEFSKSLLRLARRHLQRGRTCSFRRLMRTPAYRK